VARLIHLVIRVRDLRRSIGFYRDAFGFREARRLGFPTFTPVHLRCDASPVEIELTLNKGHPDGCKIEVLREGGHYR
jgi:lactoylglutathione lyase